ncbi:roadblock/LC7 domain-containing protein [Streptomyces sp. NPDC005573]|uniref:roadblock/LC7 domain-containing protein n=1 Tax=unclassified Streptomyces TaxID=2593676 RepID=UPI0033AD139C
MVPEQDLEAVLDELRRLRTRVPQLTGALAAGVDGLVVAHDTPGVDPEGLAALTAAALGVSVRVADATGNGGFRELLVRGERGYVATYAAGRTAVLTLLAQDRVNVGRLHLEGRRAGARVGELLDAAEAAARALRPEAPARPAPVRTRTTRTTRTAPGTEARTATDS